MSEFIYLLAVIGSLAAWVIGAWLFWRVIEGAYWLFCKATGREY